MQEKQPLVSICIPTYNRCDTLQMSIESIICQPEFQSRDVEIAISDNASIDGTEELGRSYADRFPNILYHRQAVGTPIADMNFPLVLSYGTGVLRRLSNDWLVYKPDAMHFYCEAARANRDKRPVLLFQNMENTTRDDSLLGFEGFVRTAGFFMTSISSFSAWDHDCTDIANDTKYCHTHLWQTERTLRFLPRSGGRIFFQPFFDARKPNRKKNLTFGVFPTFYTNYFKIFQPYAEKGMLSKECMDFLKKNILYVLLDHMIWQDTMDKHFTFSERENLRTLVFHAYQTEPYFPAFKKSYLDFLKDWKTMETLLPAFCNQHPSFYLYGIGKIAHKALKKLNEFGYKPAGCLVSPGHKTEDQWNGFAVHALDEFTLGEQDGILVSVGKTLQPEVREILQRYGLEGQAYFPKFPVMQNWA